MLKLERRRQVTGTRHSEDQIIAILNQGEACKEAAATGLSAFWVLDFASPAFLNFQSASA